MSWVPENPPLMKERQITTFSLLRFNPLNVGSLLVIGIALTMSRVMELPHYLLTDEAKVFAGISIHRWHQCLEIAACLWAGWEVGCVCLLYFFAWASRLTSTAFDDAIISLIARYVRGTRDDGWQRVVIYYTILYTSLLPLDLETAYPELDDALDKGLKLILGLWGLCLMWDMIELLVLRAWRGDEAAVDQSLVSALNFAKPLAVFAGLLALLSSIGVEVSSVVAGFGVGGLAVALSTQTVLQDLSAGLALLVDRPFEVGDCVLSQGFEGTVTNIGLKSTVVQALSGEVLVACNKDIAAGRISKFPSVTNRTKKFFLPIDPATDDAILANLPELITEILEAFKNGEWSNLEPGFVGVSELTGWCVMMEVQYCLKESRLRQSKTCHSAILLAVMHALRKRGVSLVSPPNL